MPLKTNVMMQTTTVTFHNALKNKIDEIEVLGKASAKEAREVIAKLCPRNTYISKNTVREICSVNTAQLHALKGS